MLVRGLTLGSLARVALQRGPALSRDEPLRVFLCVADHFEPGWLDAPRNVRHERVEAFVKGLPALAEGVVDSAGRAPKHTFFYPTEQYEPRWLDALARIRDAGLGEVEVHLHHHNDTAEGLRDKLLTFTETLASRHGLLRRRSDGVVSYGFVHGDWALDNSHPRGVCCGVNNELDVLRETGCYADFTLPAAPSPAQTTTVNSIYYAIDDPQRPKSHDRGTAARVGRHGPADSLLLVQGPLAIDWENRLLGVGPRIDYGHLQGQRSATMRRLNRWVRAGVTVVGRPNWRFVKLHTHGCDERNWPALLGDSMRSFHAALAARAKADPRFEYFYVTAREVASLVHQAESGLVAPRFPVEEPWVAAQRTTSPRPTAELHAPTRAEAACCALKATVEAAVASDTSMISVKS
ncbi:MAG: hypothetical protein ACRCT8_16095 [Lacipirellulaceae bacterium]